MPASMPPKVCPNCDKDVTDVELFCPWCGIEIGPSEVLPAKHALAVQQAAGAARSAGCSVLGCWGAYAGFLWAPLFLAVTPRWALGAQPLLLLALALLHSVDEFQGYFAITDSFHYRWGGRRSEWSTCRRRVRSLVRGLRALRSQTPSVTVLCLSACAIMLFAPTWSGWRWAFPVLGATACLVVVFGELLRRAVP